MIKVIPFEPEHIKGLELLIADKETVALCNSPECLQTLKDIGPCYTAMTQDGRVIGAAGVRPITLKTFEAWAIVGKEAKIYAKSFVKAINQFMQTMFENDAADRFQATVRMSFPEGHRFVRILKFLPEGILKNYDMGEDYMMYSRINTWLR